MNNRNLLIIFGLLLVVYLATRLFSGQKERSFNPDLVQIDTAKVSKIIMNPKKDEFVDVVLERKTTGGWQINKGDFSTEAQESSVEGLLKQVQRIKAKRITAKKKDKWTDFEVNENQGTRVRIFENSKKVADFMVGGFSFDQASRSGTTFVRPFDDDNVYAVDGFLSMTFGNGFDGFRNKKLFDLNAEEITGFSVSLPGNQYAFLKVGNEWQGPEGIAPDSVKIASFLNGLNNARGSAFFNEPTASLNKLGALEISLADGSSSSVEVFENPDGEKPFILMASANPDANFISDSTGVYKQLFKPLQEFTK